MEIEEKLRLAEEMAREMSTETKKVDENELGKLIAHLRRYRDFPQTLALLKALPSSPLKRTKKTERYYRNALDVISKHLLSPYPQPSAEDALEVLGWTMRLMRYESLRKTDQHGEDRSHRRTPR